MKSKRASFSDSGGMGNYDRVFDIRFSGLMRVTVSEAPASFSCDAVAFRGGFDEGDPDALARSGDLTGITDSGQGTISFWVEPTNLSAVAGDQPIFLQANNFGMQALLEADGTVALYSTDGSSEFWIKGSTDITALSGWHHVLMWWDTNAAPGARIVGIKLDGVSETINIISDTGSAFSAPLSSAGDWSIVHASNPFDLAELWYTAGVNVTDHTKFRSAGGKPVDLGATGSIPTGSQPLVYLHIDDGETAANFKVNAGSGGNFVDASGGSLTTAATSPSD